MWGDKKHWIRRGAAPWASGYNKSQEEGKCIELKVPTTWNQEMDRFAILLVG